jgi:hypothetical protein
MKIPLTLYPKIEYEKLKKRFFGEREKMRNIEKWREFKEERALNG